MFILRLNFAARAPSQTRRFLGIELIKIYIIHARYPIARDELAECMVTTSFNLFSAYQFYSEIPPTKTLFSH